MHAPAPGDVSWFEDQVVFLTGGTGGLGSCFLYKLALQLPVKKIFVLCRTSRREAISKWESVMPEQIDDILDSGKVSLVVGDLTQPLLGLHPTDLRTLQDEVTVAIHAAANISLFSDLPSAVRDNTLPTLNLARMLLDFKHIAALVYISSQSVTSFMPEGVVREEAVVVDKDEPPPEDQVHSILKTGHSPYTPRFIAPYAQSKYLAESFLLKMDRQASFRVLIPRLSIIAPALRDPYPFYGPEATIPSHTFLHFILTSPKYRSFDAAKDAPRSTVVDEIPVDQAVNVTLLHLAAETSGIVHAGGQLYETRTLGYWIDRVQQYSPQTLHDMLANASHSHNEEFASEAFGLGERYIRPWVFDCQRSSYLRDSVGPIGISLEDHDSEDFFRRRVEKRSAAAELLITRWAGRTGAQPTGL